MQLTDENIRGRTVIAADGNAVGEVVALLLDDHARVEALQIKLRKDIRERIGAEGSRFRGREIAVDSRYVQSVGDAVLLNVPMEQLRQAPDEAHREQAHREEQPPPAPAT